MTPQEIKDALSKIYDALEALGLDGTVINYVEEELDSLVTDDNEPGDTQSDNAQELRHIREGQK